MLTTAQLVDKTYDVFNMQTGVHTTEAFSHPIDALLNRHLIDCGCDDNALHFGSFTIYLCRFAVYVDTEKLLWNKACEYDNRNSDNYPYGFSFNNPFAYELHAMINRMDATGRHMRDYLRKKGQI